jgi:hypothetical protein
MRPAPEVALQVMTTAAGGLYEYGVVRYRNQDGRLTTASIAARLYRRACAALGAERARAIARDAAAGAVPGQCRPSRAAAAALTAALEAAHD